MLEFKRAGWEHLANQVFEHHLSDISAEFGGLQVVLQRFHGPTYLGECPGFPLQIADDLGGVKKAVINILGIIN